MKNGSSVVVLVDGVVVLTGTVDEVQSDDDEVELVVSSNDHQFIVQVLPTELQPKQFDLDEYLFSFDTVDIN